MDVPTGIIVIWSGAVVDIPAGWVLCDGTQSTPDLRNKFVPGAGDTWNPGATGGSIVHNHTFTGDGHNHEMPLAAGLTAGGAVSKTTTTDPATGTTDDGDTLPPYYALAFIMKT